MNVIKRIVAMTVAICLIAMYVATFFVAVYKSEYVMGMIFLDVIVPVVLWGMWLIARLFKRRGEELRNQEQAGDGSDDGSTC